MKEITGATRLGWAIRETSQHSISPLIHNTAFQNLGVDARYLAFDVGQETYHKSNGSDSNVSHVRGPLINAQ